MGLKGITVNTAASADAHIFAEDDAAIYQAIFGGDGVMNIGNKFAATVLSNNKVRVSDGVLCVGGHIGRMQYADYADLTIENGVSGKKRNDIIYAKFVTSGDIDSYVLDVRKGTAGTTAADPAMTQGNLYQGATLREYPLWRVKIEGLSIVKVEQMFSVIPTIPELQKEMQNGLSEVNSKLNLKIIRIYPIVDFDTTLKIGYFNAPDIPEGYSVIAVNGHTNYPHADLIFCNYDNSDYVGVITISSRTITEQAIIEFICRKN